MVTACLPLAVRVSSNSTNESLESKMATFGKTLFSVLLTGLLALGFVACGGSDGGNDTATPDVTTDNGGDDTADTVVAKKQFSGILIDFQTRKGLAGAKLYVLDNATGKETGEVLTSSGADTPATDDDGIVTAEFDGALDKVGFVARLEGQKDTYQLHLPADGQNETLWSVSNGTYVAAPALAGISIDSTKGILAGGLYFRDAAGEEEGVGCGKIRVLEGVGDPETFAEANVRYMNSAGLPTTLANQDSINPEVPFFIIGNIPESKDAQGNDLPVTVTAKMGETAIGDTYVFSKADAIFIGNIFTYTAANAPTGVDPVTVNPMPAGCGQ